MLEVIFLFAEKVVSGHRKLFTNLFWLPQIANLETRANNKDNIPFWHFRNEDSSKENTVFCYPNCIWLKLKNSQRWKEFLCLMEKKTCPTEPKRNSPFLLFSQGMIKAGRGGEGMHNPYWFGWILSIWITPLLCPGKQQEKLCSFAEGHYA